ncbi:helix-turn-helix transcriptional regulator [Streptomyces sp. CSDS2]|uniref:helix-turn-helix transcriptional regulator n=1 Tax=Streptomyces sp. CSDS2 TaxID=3055051 RepID=UPI0025B1A16E|nr:helix-turn-helix transcriptional regulator [Streptomyces sp. CSDS2]
MNDAARRLSCSEREIQKIIDDLVELRLVKPDGDGLFMTADPSAAIDAPAQATAYASFFSAGRIAGGAGAGSKELLDLESACVRMHEVAAESTDEVVAMLPGGGRPILELLECEPPMLTQGIRTRLLLQHTARFDSAAREQAEALIDKGAEIRTVAPLFEQLIVFDATTAFLPVVEADWNAVAMVRDPTVVAFLCACFERAWAGARHFVPRLGQHEVISDDLKGEILRMLINGAKDDTIARRLGLSVRTCRKYIAQLMRQFGVATRFQLGYAVRRGKVLAED